MYAASDAFNQAIKSSGRIIKAKVEIGTQTFLEDTIVDYKVDDVVVNGDSFTIGSVISKSLDLNLVGTSALIEGQRIKVHLGLDMSGAIEYVPLGEFFSNEVIKNNGVTAIKAYDKLSGFEDEYISALNYPSTSTQILNELANLIGLELDVTLSKSYEITSALRGYSRRDALGFIAGLYGANVRLSRDNKITFKYFNPTPVDIFATNNYSVFTKSESQFTISKICSKFGDVVVTRGDDSGNAITLINPLVSDNILDDLYLSLNNVSFRAGTLIGQGNPCLDAGDIITIEGKDSVSYSIMVSKLTHSYTGGFGCSILSIGESVSQSVYEAKRFETKRTVTEMNIELGKISTDVHTMDERLGEAESTITQQSGEIASKVSKTELKTLGNSSVPFRFIKNRISGTHDNADNHWLSVKAIALDGTDRALDATVTLLDVNSDILTVVPEALKMPISTFGLNNTGVIVDLGAIYSDISYIKVVHNSGVVYKDNVVSISEDGVVWTTIFDTTINGSYIETPESKMLVLNQGGTLSDLNETTRSMYSEVIQTAEQISLKVSKDDIISQINQTAEEITIEANKIGILGEANIPDLKADKIKGGSLVLGGSSIKGEMLLNNLSDVSVLDVSLDENNMPNMKVFTPTGVLKAKIGQFSTGYGIECYDDNGNVVWNTSNMPAVNTAQLAAAGQRVFGSYSFTITAGSGTWNIVIPLGAKYNYGAVNVGQSSDRYVGNYDICRDSSKGFGWYYDSNAGRPYPASGTFLGCFSYSGTWTSLVLSAAYIADDGIHLTFTTSSLPSDKNMIVWYEVW